MPPKKREKKDVKMDDETKSQDVCEGNVDNTDCSNVRVQTGIASLIDDCRAGNNNYSIEFKFAGGAFVMKDVKRSRILKFITHLSKQLKMLNMLDDEDEAKEA